MSAANIPFADQFERVRHELPGSDALRAQREAAFARFAATGLPNRKLERWHYTDFARLGTDTFDLVRRPTAYNDALIDALRLPIVGRHVVFVDGSIHDARSQNESNGTLAMQPLATGWAALADGFTAHARLEAHPLALLNTAFTRDGLIVRVPPHFEQPVPIVIAFLGQSPDATAAQPRIVVDIGAHAAAEIVLHFADHAGRASWTNVVTEIRQEPGSRLSLIRVQEHGAEQVHTSLTTASVGRDAALRVGAFELGGHTVRNDIDVTLDASGASADLYGAFLALDGQHVDTQILIEHDACETRSRQAFRGIAGSRGRGVFSGKVVVRPNAQRIDAQQRADNLLLDKTAEIDARPALEIYADDVKCSHGATIGELDPQQLFYLESRGIGADAARALLTFAFANAALAQVANTELRGWLLERIAKRLPAHERWEQLLA